MGNLETAIVERDGVVMRVNQSEIREGDKIKDESALTRSRSRSRKPEIEKSSETTEE